ncbi:MAG: hypothetical protein NC311_04530 [Muribaculaceae bacterium]|nr:hypothetical protein [Muribaculaceae bacterium]
MNIQKFIDKKLPVGALVRNLPYVVIFKTTNYCWFKCPHCCENSGPHQPKTFIPLGAIHYYLNQAATDPKFSGNVVFTGGEIMSSYRFGDPKYVPTLLNMCLQANIGTDIKTNAGWARTSFANDIYSDLGNVINNNKKYGLQISLSLDKFHTNSLENNTAILERFAVDKLPVRIHIASFQDYQYMWPELQDALRKRGVRVDDGFILSGDQVQPVTTLNNSVIINFSTAQLFDGGRARNLAVAQHTEFPQFKFMTHDGTVLMAFDTMGRVTLGENSGRKISTKWDAGHDKVFTMTHIRDTLVRQARHEEFRAKLFQNWRGVK